MDDTNPIVVNKTTFDKENDNDKVASKALCVNKVLGTVCNNLSILGTAFLFKDGIIENPIAATTFGLADFCFLSNDYLHIMTNNYFNTKKDKSNKIKFVSETLTSLPSLALIPTAVVLFNMPFPTDKYIVYHVAIPFISATALGALATVIDKAIKINDYCNEKIDDNRHGYSSIDDYQSKSKDNKTSSKMVLSSMTKAMSNISMLGVTVGLISFYTMLQEQNDANPENPENHNLTGFYLLGAPIIYNAINASFNLIGSSYRGTKTILAKATSWCTSQGEETAALINSLSETRDFIQPESQQSSRISI